MKKMLSKALVLLLVVALIVPFQMLATTDANFYYDESEVLYEEMLFIEDFLSCPEFTDYLSSHFIYEFGEEFMNNLDTATAMADHIWDSFPTNRAGHRMYPDAFGGTYIDDYGNLVLLLVSDVADIGDMATHARSTDISTRYVDFSHAELLQVFETIYYFLRDNWEDTTCLVVANIDSVSIDVIYNRVNVSLIDMSEYSVEQFNALVVEHPSLVFVQSVNCDAGGYVVSECHMTVCATEQLLERSVSHTVRPGNAILRSIPNHGNFRQSIGFRATRNGHTGFVTTMHGPELDYGNDIRRHRPLQRFDTFFFGGGVTDQHYIGWVDASNAATDSVFVILELRHSIVNTGIAGTGTNVIGAEIMRNPQRGHPVTRFSQGGTTSPVSSMGSIMETHHIHNVAALGPVQTILASYTSIGGDSGGIILSHNLHVAGIHVGRVANTPTAHSAFSRAERIVRYLGVTPF